MVSYQKKSSLFTQVINRPERKVVVPTDGEGRQLRISEYFAANVFQIQNVNTIPRKYREEINEVISGPKTLTKALAEVMADALLNWALSKGVTHFCHWFQPLTGATAEKHDSFIHLDYGADSAIEKLSASQLIKGEPDASSFPNGGARSTFEARGYTCWDLTSPIFIMEGPNGKTLCIPTAFISYLGDALDTKTPLLRSLSCIDKAATKFLHLIGHKDVKKVTMTVGAEQEYFLIDKEFYYNRPDLVMCGRTLIGSITPKNQQLEDHYFGTMEDRILSFMQELEIELYKLGIPAKTRHNEVAPGQYELAQIFQDANTSADQNQVLMVQIKKIALKHHFVALMHEKPFAGVNGSGKHLNWSLSDDQGRNLLEPGENPQTNYSFMALIAVILEAVYRHGEALRFTIASHGNDFRLGANEAPPSIISVYLGETLNEILNAMVAGQKFTPNQNGNQFDMQVDQLAKLLIDNSDRNRTSPFAFTGNKFEFRAVGSSAATGFPTTILAGAVAEVLNETNLIIEEELKSGKSIEESLLHITRKWGKHAEKIVFNGDGYSQSWVNEAEQRGLPHLRNTAEVLHVLKDPTKIEFLKKQGIFTAGELDTRHNVMVERYNKISEIEFKTMKLMIDQYVFPACFEYKKQLSCSIEKQKSIGISAKVETEVCKKLNRHCESLYDLYSIFDQAWGKCSELHDEELAHVIAEEMIPLFERLRSDCNEIERIVPEQYWGLPKYYDMMFIR